MTQQELDDLLHEHASAHGVPGAAIGVLRDGVETLSFYGVANATTGMPVTAETRFGVGSLTKSMVATVVARLAEERRLSLDDPVVAHVPELGGAIWAERATVRDLLANRSGLPLRMGLEFDFAAGEEDDGELSRLAARVGAEAPSRVDWSYTNAGWCLLGRAIETVTGSVWEEAMRAVLTEPTGMRDTTFSTESRSDARASGHRLAADRPVPVEPLVSRAFGPAGTSIAATVADMLRFAALHLEHPAFATLRGPQPAPRIHGWLDGWCLGWGWFDWEGGRAWGWDSVLPGERAVLRLVPERNAAVVLMTNGDNGRAVYRSLFADLMRSSFEIGVRPLRLDADPGVAGDLTRFAGVYAWPDRRVEVTALSTTLLIRNEEGDTEARPLDERTFVVDPADADTPTVTFGAFDAAGRPQVLYLMIWGLPRLED